MHGLIIGVFMAGVLIVEYGVFDDAAAEIAGSWGAGYLSSRVTPHAQRRGGSWRARRSCMAWRFQQQDKRKKALSNGDW
jgi:hypothetical protein